MVSVEKREFIDEFKGQWKSMWHNRIDDVVRAEGIADKDYSLLFVDRGTVIIATRRFKPPDFYEILQQYKHSICSETVPLNPSVGGWGKFVRSTLIVQNRSKRGRPAPAKLLGHSGQQLKKSGRGWLHSER